MNATPTPTSPTRRSGVRTAWLIGGSILTLLVLVWGVAQVVTWIARTETEVTASESAEGLKGVTIEVSNGSLLVRGSTGESDTGESDTGESDTGETVQVSGTLVSDLIAPNFEHHREGDRWVVRARCPLRPLPSSCGATLVLDVPEGLDVRVRASNTPVQLVGVSADLDVTTSNEGVRGEDLTGGTLQVRTSNGRVALSEIRSPEVDVTTSNDRVELSFDVPPASLVVRTSNDRVSVVLPDSSPPYAVDLTTSNGTVSNQVRSDPTAPRRIDVRTSNDDIAVHYPG